MFNCTFIVHNVINILYYYISFFFLIWDRILKILFITRKWSTGIYRSSCSHIYTILNFKMYWLQIIMYIIYIIIFCKLYTCMHKKKQVDTLYLTDKQVFYTYVNIGILFIDNMYLWYFPSKSFFIVTFF